MRYAETHFEQVPIEVVETVLQRAAVLARTLEELPAPASAPERQDLAEVLNLEQSTPSKGKL